MKQPRMAVALASFALAVMVRTVAAATCPDFNVPVPDVVTLMASKTNPATDAWVISPECKLLTTIKASNMASVKNMGIERVDSVPTDTTDMYFSGNPLTRGADFSGATKATKLTIEQSHFTPDPNVLVLPPFVETLYIVSAPELTSLENIKFPITLQTLWVGDTGVKTLKNAGLPARLDSLVVNRVTTADFQFIPQSVTNIAFSSMSIGTLERVPLPSALNTFSCLNCGISRIRGVKWPSTLSNLILASNTVSSFEIRQSDVAMFQKLSFASGTFSQTSCSGSGSLKDVGLLKVCVISDSDFETQYVNSPASNTGPSPNAPPPNAPPPNAPSPNAPSPNGPADGNGDSSSPLNPPFGGKEGSSFGGSIALPPSPSRNKTGGGSLVLEPSGSLTGSSGAIRPDGTSGSNSLSGATSNRSPSSARPPTVGAVDKDISISNGSSASSGSLVPIILGCVLGALILGMILYKGFASRKKRQQKTLTESPLSSNEFQRTDTPSTNSDSRAQKNALATATSSEIASLAIDLRNDKELLRCRIDQVVIGKQIARGGYGVVHRGSYQGRVVAIKQMLPDAWRNDSMVATFLDEIHMCTRLDHPKVVEFVGVSWSSLRDLSLVTEFMAGGDLHSTLRKYPESSGREWTRPWTTSNLRAKSLIAMDVAEALVYLHSFNSPIIHRDLKAKNVLLDLVGNAKLSDFGISRKMSIDETMTSEIGTAAWIAPEVLRGERYSEKADIYSLGVLLVELDRCCHPFANEPMLMMGSSTHGGLGGGNSSNVAHKNTQIAVLVSTGKLRPSTSNECPEEVAALVAGCLRFEASERPTAMELFYQYRQFRKANEEATEKSVSQEKEA